MNSIKEPDGTLTGRSAIIQRENDDEVAICILEHVFVKAEDRERNGGMKERTRILRHATKK